MDIRALPLCMSFLVQPFKSGINSDGLESRLFVKNNSYFGEGFGVVFAKVVHTVQGQHTRWCLTKIHGWRIILETQFLEIFRQNAVLLFFIGRVGVTIGLNFECDFSQFLRQEK